MLCAFLWTIAKLARVILSGCYCLGLLAIDMLGPALRHGTRIRIPSASQQPVRPGVSVIIPERQNRPLLEECLQSLVSAVENIADPVEIIVVVNGSNRRDYLELANQYPTARWIHFPQPLGFSQAILEGLKAARHDWVYLLNNDMIVDRQTLREALRWRAPHVFAVASQIYFKDPTRRREETGWTDFRLSDGRVEIFDVAPEDQRTVRGTLYAGGGSSLFQKAQLQEVLDAHAYHPFYWEDVEWGVLAWKKGYEVLFCPTSRVWHCHRATVCKFYPQSEVERIFQRNGIVFQLRNGPELGRAGQLFRWIAGCPHKTLLELLSPRTLLGVLNSRLRSFLFPLDGYLLPWCSKKYYYVPFRSLGEKPVILVVSPYAVYPPSHGGAVRMHKLLRGLTSVFHVVLLSDEADVYSPASVKYFADFASIHLVGGRKESTDSVGQRILRIVSHCHSVLRKELSRLMDCHQPSLVQIEFMELAGLVDMGKRGLPWVLTLHEVLLSAETVHSGSAEAAINAEFLHEVLLSPSAGHFSTQAWYAASLSKEDKYELNLIQKFDAVTVCSEEDASLLPDGKVALVPNGLEYERGAYIPSGTVPAILFLGPFRYAPNLEGIRTFLEKVYPSLKAKFPNVKLWLLGGHGGLQAVSGETCFQQDGVTVFDFVERPRELLDRCALTINPVYNIRGSSVKVLESMAAGRVCVSTREGARGLLDAHLSSLIPVEKIEDFGPVLERLLLDSAYRVSIEWPPEHLLRKYAWNHSAERSISLIRSLIHSEDERELTPAGYGRRICG